MKLKNRFNNRFAMLPIPGTTYKYRRDYDASYFRLQMIDKLNEIMEKKFDDMIRRLELNQMFNEITAIK